MRPVVLQRGLAGAATYASSRDQSPHHTIWLYLRQSAVSKTVMSLHWAVSHIRPNVPKFRADLSRLGDDQRRLSSFRAHDVDCCSVVAEAGVMRCIEPSSIHHTLLLPYYRTAAITRDETYMSRSSTHGFMVYQDTSHTLPCPGTGHGWLEETYSRL